MTRLPHYAITPSAYLFPGVLQSAAAQTLEEPVRQWCAYELIRAYGYPIVNLEFERPVKVGSKVYEIDILVLREGSPWIVVECKEPKYSQHNNALEQAISYASAQGVHAEFVLYTNGALWLVRRNVQNLWMAVDDLPSRTQVEVGQNFVEVLEGLYELKPILHKLDEPIAGLDARCLLDHLQRFFCISNPLLKEVNTEAIDASDHLLRVLADKSHHINYRIEKLNHARRKWEQFRSEKSIGYEIRSMDVDGAFRPLLGGLLSNLERLLSALTRPLTLDALVLRLNIALLVYGLANESEKGPYQPITPAIHQALRDLVNALLALSFHSQLPDPLQREENSRMKIYCEGAWNELREALKRAE